MKTLGVFLLTLRELWAMKVVLGLFIVSTLIWALLAFALNLDVVDGSIAGLRIFGGEATPTDSVKDPETGDWVQTALSLDTFVVGVSSFVAGAAYWVSTLLGLFATAPLMSGLLERGRIDLMLSKPLGRPQILVGHVLAVWATVFALALYLLGMVWLALSIKTGVWHPRFLLAIPIVTAMFAVMYSIVTFMGVWTQSTALSLMAAYGLIFASIILQFEAQLAPQINPPWRSLFLGLYHALPHFAEVTPLVVQLAGADAVAGWYPLWASIACGAVVYAAAAALFARRDF